MWLTVRQGASKPSKPHTYIPPGPLLQRSFLFILITYTILVALHCIKCYNIVNRSGRRPQEEEGK